MSDLHDMYVDAQERRHWSRPPWSILSGLSSLLDRRPELEDLGIGFLAEAVRSAA